MDADIYKVIEAHTGKSIKDFSKKELDSLVEKYEKMKYDYGEAIGVVAAQSIAEPATQTTLRSYHAAGRVQLVTTKGLPRLIELFDARRQPKTPSMTIYLKREFNNKDDVFKFASNIKETVLKQVLSGDALDLTNMSIELFIDKEAMNSYDLSVEKIMNAIRKTTKNVELYSDGDKIIVTMSKEDVSIKELQQMRIKLRTKYLKGLKEIKQVLVEKEGDEWIIRTIGSNLKKILKYKEVDGTRTKTNDIFEVKDVLGIEAARALIVEEVLETMREQGVDTNERHILLVADTMTFDGTIKPIGRYGLAGSKNSVLARANFEETVKHLSMACLKGEIDPLNSVVENVIIGNMAPIGTGVVKLKYKG